MANGIFTRPTTGAVLVNPRRVTGTSEYRTWEEIRRRCYSPKLAQYKDYGGRGIQVCEAWRKSFWAFYADMGPKPSPELTIERLDNDGNYEPNNCKWATRLEQARNQRPRKCKPKPIPKGRPRKTLTVNGVTKPIAEWAAAIGVSYPTLAYRLKVGWPLEEVITRKGHPKRRNTSKIK